MVYSADSSILAHLTKVSSTDTDYRYMAVNDLAQDIKNRPVCTASFDTAPKVIQAIRTLLNDSNGEVQTVTILNLPILARVLPQSAQTELAQVLSANWDEAESPTADHSRLIQEGLNTPFREVQGFALKTFLTDLLPEAPAARNIIQQLLPLTIQRLANLVKVYQSGITPQSSAPLRTEHVAEALDLLSLQSTRFRPHVREFLTESPTYGTIFRSGLWTLLTSPHRVPARGRAQFLLASLLPLLTDGDRQPLLDDLKCLLESATASGSKSASLPATEHYLALFQVLCRHCPALMAIYLPILFPM
ncbi:hypothetical protein BJ085DRAFT_32093 [Dimargaris cristalligena]|uniref:Uncharacterized protein n=1 Tax=Dimargaris cristalligena TaxID=215637 RepID=A0A4V1J3Y4_9FUNG|nr:hypothetical protein BJ085DRAFT_32093 [Dimargaris cristalligena]|eukprot:RKP33669.1 hypothetical protein BJ085DRAFT_32093 [Dimargaris cristalligena]